MFVDDILISGRTDRIINHFDVIVRCLYVVLVRIYRLIKRRLIMIMIIMIIMIIITIIIMVNAF